MQWNALKPGQITVLSGELKERIQLVRSYMLSLNEDLLLQNFYYEAGLRIDYGLPEVLHGGWESPTCQLRGHFLGHYLSACAFAWAYYGDSALKGRGDSIVRALARCQEENGGRWVFSIPATYLEWLERGKKIWAPQYTLHKTLMGLADMARYAGSEEALSVAERAADWFYEWSGRFTRDQFHDILDVETGGMLEVWADLYGLTKNGKYLELFKRYERPRLFEPLLEGRDVLTNMHANTTIPEMLGLARAWELTGEKRYLNIIEAYWRMAVDDRGTFATGGQTCDELWTPPFKLSDRLGPENQEHCVVYNMIRLADFLTRATGDIRYADYIERNFDNGILTQQHPGTGMVAYYLPMNGGGKVNWGTRTQHFWCCHGTLVQAHMRHGADFCYQSGDALRLAQYHAMRLTHEATGVCLDMSEFDGEMSTYAPNAPRMEAFTKRPFARRYRIRATAGAKPMKLILRVPWWTSGDAVLYNAVGTEAARSASGEIAVVIDADVSFILEIPCQLSVCPLPDAPGTFAFMEGPDVLVGLTALTTLDWDGDIEDAWKMLRPMTRLPFTRKFNRYTALGQREKMEFIPARYLADETFTMYFSVRH